MNILIAFYDKEGEVSKVSEALKQVFEIEEHSVTLEEIKPKQLLKEPEYSKLESVQLLNKNLDVSKYDLIVIGTPVWSFFPSPVITSYLKQLKNSKNKNFALFIVCVLPGNAIKKMSNILTTQGANVVSTLTLQSIFKLNEKKLESVKNFAYEIIFKIKKK